MDDAAEAPHAPLVPPHALIEDAVPVSPSPPLLSLPLASLAASDSISQELDRIAELEPPVRAAALEALESRLRRSLDEISTA